jgi:hypothetical protein
LTCCEGSGPQLLPRNPSATAQPGRQARALPDPAKGPAEEAASGREADTAGCRRHLAQRGVRDGERIFWKFSVNTSMSDSTVGEIDPRPSRTSPGGSCPRRPASTPVLSTTSRIRGSLRPGRPDGSQCRIRYAGAASRREQFFCKQRSLSSELLEHPEFTTIPAAIWSLVQ